MKLFLLNPKHFLNVISDAGRKIGECQLDASNLIRLSEENVNTLNAKNNDNSCAGKGSNQNNGNLFRNGRKFIDNDGNVSEDFDSNAAVVVRASSKQNRASPATDTPTYGHNGGSKDPMGINSDTNIEAGCEILCLKFLSGSEEGSFKSRGTYFIF